MGIVVPPGVGELAQAACLMEVTARKPGNVQPGKNFEDTHLLDFLLSASAIVGPMERARSIGVGPAVLEAVEATARVVATNTNLGMILLMAPIATLPAGGPLEEGVARVLGATTIEDARCVFRAIREAKPGGLGRADAEDVTDEPTLRLVDVMRLAADRDLVARQYVNGYAEVFRIALRTLIGTLDRGLPLETAIVLAHLDLMASRPDTLIARKRGFDEAAESSRRAAEVLAAGWPDTRRGRSAFDSLDEWLRAEGHARNPGTTADLVAAALFSALRMELLRFPWSPGRWSGDF